MAVRHLETRARAKELRRAQTGPETLLWSRLRGGRLGVKFQRQVVLAPWVADFAARAHRLAIELDGETHVGREEYDAARTRDLQSRGWRVLRFTNDDVLTNLDGVLRAILIALGRDPDNPRPLQGERDSRREATAGRGGSHDAAPVIPHSPLSPRR